MADYTILALMILFCAGLPYALNPRFQKIGFWFCVSVLMTLSSLRGANIGNDTPIYIYLFENLNIANHSRFEIGYVWLTDIIKKFTDNYQYLFVVVSIFIYYSFGRFIVKYSKMPWLSLYLFFTYGFFAFTFTAIRQGIAMTICLYAFEAFMSGKYIKTTLLILGASLFHSTAIVFFLVFLCKFIKPKVKVFLTGYITAIVLLIALTSVLNYVFMMLPMYEHYTHGSYIGETGVAGFLYTGLSSIILLFSYKQFSKVSLNKKSITTIDSYGLIMVFFAILLYIISIKANIFDRLAIYFNMFALIVFPNAISRLNGIRRQITIITVIIAFFIYSAIIITYRPEWISLYPYKFCWQN